MPMHHRWSSELGGAWDHGFRGTTTQQLWGPQLPSTATRPAASNVLRATQCCADPWAPPIHHPQQHVRSILDTPSALQCFMAPGLLPSQLPQAFDPALLSLWRDPWCRIAMAATPGRAALWWLPTGAKAVPSLGVRGIHPWGRMGDRGARPPWQLTGGRGTRLHWQLMDGREALCGLPAQVSSKYFFPPSGFQYICQDWILNNRLGTPQGNCFMFRWHLELPVITLIIPTYPNIIPLASHCDCYPRIIQLLSIIILLLFQYNYPNSVPFSVNQHFGPAETHSVPFL